MTILVFMLVTNMASMQSHLFYPQNHQCQEVAQAIQNFGGQARCQTSYVPKTVIPPGNEVPAYLLVANNPSVGVNPFYMTNSSCQSVGLALRQGGFKTQCTLVRVPQSYVQ